MSSWTLMAHQSAARLPGKKKLWVKNKNTLNMKSSLLGPLVLLALSSILVSGSKYYIPIKLGLTWEEAQNYCKRHYTDLATISYASEANSMDLKKYLVWSGLKKDKEFPNWWLWSDGKFYRPDWATKEPNKGSCAAVNFENKK
ncbi:hypothetical protein ILYODFUR_037151 [Ilyodon furcidens]|uniref:C-type lectin domain-containing protein n=1 Tax=Ilyodon furcidens TaxID=33524 RepID=A0ABV0SVW7_9TELE